MTIELCQNACKSVYYRYAGVENKEDCYCGEHVNEIVILPTEDCDLNCPGNVTQFCGGDTTMNIYSLLSKCEEDDREEYEVTCDAKGAYEPRQCNYDLESTFCYCFTTDGDELPGTRIYPYFQQLTVDDIHCPEYFVGECVLDDVSDRILTGHSYQDDALTQEKCKTTCENMQFNYAGVEDANVCFCGNMIPELTFLPSPECNYECSGDSHEMCGGKTHMNIFTLPPILRNFPNATSME